MNFITFMDLDGSEVTTRSEMITSIIISSELNPKAKSLIAMGSLLCMVRAEVAMKVKDKWMRVQ
ncbi:MAG TPA: hypothetical protein VNX68_15025 [Nitrosopumilaceae archaeon]|jgi:hypothetical protein|nr:hypothetical protein [Nitrosopumilaceae archaeon]